MFFSLFIFQLDLNCEKIMETLFYFIFKIKALFFNSKNMYNLNVIIHGVIKLFFISNLGETIAKIAVVLLCVAALVAIVIFIVINLSKNKVYKKVKDFNVKLGESNNYLKENIAHSINRFYVIAQLNDEYQTHYEYFSKKKDSLTSKYISDLNSRSSKLEELVEKKNVKEIRTYLSTSMDVLKVFNNEISILESEIEVFLSKDMECHNHAIPFQKRYREIKDIYDNNKESLNLIENTIYIIFTKIDGIFEEFDKLTESAHYDQAIAKIDTLSSVFDALKKALEELPLICARLNLVIPKKIEELGILYSKLEEENYPLYHLKVNTTIEDIKVRLTSIKKQIESFSYKHVSLYLDEINDKIEELSNLLQQEIEAKMFFDENNKSIYEKSYELEKLYMKTKRIMPEYKKVYDINEAYIDIMNETQKDITVLGGVRRDLDNYIHTSAMQPYSILKRKLVELIDLTEDIDKKIGHVTGYLKSLKIDSDEAYKMLDKTYMSLKLLEYKLSEMDIVTFKESLENDFKQAYTSLDNIGMLIKITPINVEALNLSRNKINELENKIRDIIENSGDIMRDAENSIVYANRFRKDFFDVRQSLINAEESFFAGKFNESFDVAVSSIKQVKKM